MKRILLKLEESYSIYYLDKCCELEEDRYQPFSQRMDTLWILRNLFTKNSNSLEVNAGRVVHIGSEGIGKTYGS